MKKLLKFITIDLLLLALSLVVISCEFKVPYTDHFINQPYDNENIYLGYPDKVTDNSPSNKNNYMISRDAYVLSYNNTKHIPNWVSWHLDEEDMGGFSRTDFRVDTDLPSGFDLISTSEYSRSGFDRGHMCPSHARSAKAYLRDQTYYMTNIVPQNPKNNQVAWKSLEDTIQGSVEHRKKEAYVVCGTYGVGGQTGDNGSGAPVGVDRDYIGKNYKITVPSHTWKVAIVISNGDGDDIKRINNLDISQIAVYAVWMPNNQQVKSNYTDHLVSIDFIEEKTGYDFFSRLDDHKENLIEAFNSEYDEAHGKL